MITKFKKWFNKNNNLKYKVGDYIHLTKEFGAHKLVKITKINGKEYYQYKEFPYHIVDAAEQDFNVKDSEILRLLNQDEIDYFNKVMEEIKMRKRSDKYNL